MEQKGTNVQVAVRCRPMSASERTAGQPSVINCDQQARTIQVSYGPTGKKILKSFAFDKVFGMYSTQEEVFEQVVRPIVEEALAGFNCTIFAYGQTGTGKTHTMEGDIHSEENAGIVPRSVKAILEQLEASGTEFTIRVSFLELYNEELQDLLNTNSDKKIKLCEDVKRGVVCQNLEEITVLNVRDIFEILQRGILQRQTAETLCNKNSSRSHSIFTMKIMIKESNFDGEEVVRHGQLNLVDLAGSECVGRSGAKNDRAREAGSINQSLLTLGRCISALIEHQSHIPYRDSKLTRLLQESLGGKAKTCIIATLSPSHLATEETLSTLDYAHKAKSIKNQPAINQKMTKKVVLKEYCAEIESLRSQLQITREKNGIYVLPDVYYAMEARILSQEGQLNECEAALKSKNDEIKYLKNENFELCSQNSEYKLQLEQLKIDLEQSKNNFTESQKALESTKFQLKASNAVIQEQIETEKRLHVQSSELQNEVQKHRNDNDILLSKVDQFVTNENNRLRQTKTVVAHLNGLKLTMENNIRQFKSANDNQINTLSTGISEMLKESRHTCTILQSSIEGSLKMLVGNARKANESMTSSCADLNSHLTETNRSVASTLTGIQQVLSDWLIGINDSIITSHKCLLEQQNQLDRLSEDIAAYGNSYNRECDALVEIQQKNCKTSIGLIQNIRQSFLGQIDTYRAAQRDNQMAATQSLQLQASALEQSIKSMVADMVAQAAATYAAHCDDAISFCAEVETAQSTNLTSVEDAIKSHLKEHIMVTRSSEQKFIQASQSQQNIIKSITTSRENAESSLQTLSGSVVAQRVTLDEKVTVTVKHLNDATNESCNIVNESSKVANNILEDISSATQTINTDTGFSLQKFTSLLDSEEEVLSQKLTQYFAVAHDHCDNVSSDLSDLSSRINIFDSELAATQVQATGSTPKKTVFPSMATLASTRSHEAIRSEILKEISTVIQSSPNVASLNETMYSTCSDFNQGPSSMQGLAFEPLAPPNHNSNDENLKPNLNSSRSQHCDSKTESNSKITSVNTTETGLIIHHL